jgi:alkylation response protein AidB-like acyl-CoA dehydrogenase
MKAGSQYLKDLVARDAITGKIVMALAISEPYAGSDVVNLKTTAKRVGDHYILNGAKKFITSGVKADYITVAARTGDEGYFGISLLLVDAKTPGVSARRMETQGWWLSNTAYVTFDNVKVPIKNLIGKENHGFLLIMANFNRERFSMAIMSNRYARICLEESIRFARERHTFGKRLIDHQAIRHKIAEMARMIETTHALIEQVAFQFKSNVGDQEMAGSISLLKVQATKTFELCAKEATQILGGAGVLREGKGERVERLYREVRVQCIGGGSEEIMYDLAMRQAKL